jgi:hypothetical protein
MNRLNKTNRQYNYTISEQPPVIIQIRYEISLVSIIVTIKMVTFVYHG